MVGSRFLWAMKMCLWAGRICLDQDLPGHALEMFDRNLRRRAQRREMMENGNAGRYAGPDIAHAGSVELGEVV